MPAHRKVPRGEELAALIARFHTHEAIAAHLSRTSGYVSRAAVSIVIAQERLSTSHRPRHDRFIPWHLRATHDGHYPAKMLRLYSRREGGEALPVQYGESLDRWLAALARKGEAVSYDRERGFYRVKAGSAGYAFDGPIAVAHPVEEKAG